MHSYKRYIIEKLTYMSGPRVALLFSSIFFGFVFIVCMTASSAWSHEMKSVPVVKPASLSSPGPDGSHCLPLLNSISTSPKSVTGPTQRPAGTAAALGLIMGMRFALAPAPRAEKPQKQANISDSEALAGLSPSAGPGDDRTALAIAAYRQCQKELALQSLQTFRWHR